jgi:hypothetical protein
MVPSVPSGDSPISTYHEDIYTDTKTDAGDDDAAPVGTNSGTVDGNDGGTNDTPGADAGTNEGTTDPDPSSSSSSSSSSSGSTTDPPPPSAPPPYTCTSGDKSAQCVSTKCNAGYHAVRGVCVPKGNNGVGNGVDPQPPGNPPVNDGPGTSPGNPGNKGGH